MNICQQGPRDRHGWKITQCFQPATKYRITSWPFAGTSIVRTVYLFLDTDDTRPRFGKKTSKLKFWEASPSLLWPNQASHLGSNPPLLACNIPSKEECFQIHSAPFARNDFLLWSRIAEVLSRSSRSLLKHHQDPSPPQWDHRWVMFLCQYMPRRDWKRMPPGRNAVAVHDSQCGYWSRTTNCRSKAAEEESPMTSCRWPWPRPAYWNCLPCLANLARRVHLFRHVDQRRHYQLDHVDLGSSQTCWVDACALSMALSLPCQNYRANGGVRAGWTKRRQHGFLSQNSGALGTLKISKNSIPPTYGNGPWSLCITFPRCKKLHFFGPGLSVSDRAGKSPHVQKADGQTWKTWHHTLLQEKMAGLLSIGFWQIQIFFLLCCRVNPLFWGENAMPAPLNIKPSNKLQGSWENYVQGSSGYGAGLVLSGNENSEKSW